MNEHDRFAEYLETGRIPDGSDAPYAEVRAGLSDDSAWLEPPADLADTIVAEIREAAGATERAPAPQRRRPRSAWLASVAAVVVFAVAAAAAVLLLADRDGSSGQQVALGGTDLAPGATATALVEELPNGARIDLDISALPPAPPGSYYQGWLKSPDDELVTIGTFHMRGGDGSIALWAGVDLDEYDTITVTRQTEGAGQESSGQVVLSGAIE